MIVIALACLLALLVTADFHVASRRVRDARAGGRPMDPSRDWFVQLAVRGPVVVFLLLLILASV